MRRRISGYERETERVQFPLILRRASHTYEFVTTVQIDDANDQRVLQARFDFDAIRQGETVDVFDGDDRKSPFMRLNVVEAAKIAAYSLCGGEGPEIGRIISSFRPEATPALHLYRGDGLECGRLKPIGAWKRFLGLVPVADAYLVLNSDGERARPRYTIDLDGRPGMSLASLRSDPKDGYADASLTRAIARKHHAFETVDERLILAGLAVLAGHSHLGEFEGGLWWLPDLWP